MKTVGILVVGLAGAGCSPESGPAFVAGEGATETIEISTDRGPTPSLMVGEPLVLHARRTSGPWVETHREAVAGPCWWGAPPPSVEPEVADNIRWIADPSDAARFNLDVRSDHAWVFRFSEPGTYVLEARSALTCSDFTVDSLTVQFVHSR